MADELPDSTWKALEQQSECPCVEITRCSDSDRTLCGANVPMPDLRLGEEASLQGAKKVDLSTTRQPAASERNAPGLLEGIADRPDAEAHGHSEQWPENSREKMSVFVAVEVRWADSCIEQPRDLSCGFPLDLRFVQLPEESGARERRQRRPKTDLRRRQERRDGVRRREWIAIEKNDVATNAESG